MFHDLRARWNRRYPPAVLIHLDGSYSDRSVWAILPATQLFPHQTGPRGFCRLYEDHWWNISWVFPSLNTGWQYTNKILLQSSWTRGFKDSRGQGFKCLLYKDFISAFNILAISAMSFFAVPNSPFSMKPKSPDLPWIAQGSGGFIENLSLIKRNGWSDVIACAVWGY